MPQDNGVFKGILGSDPIPGLLAESVCNNINAVCNHQTTVSERMFSIQPFPGLGAACNQTRGAGQQEQPHGLFVDPGEQTSFYLQGGMGMADPNGNTAGCCAQHDKTAVEHGVGVNDLKAVCCDQPAKTAYETGVAGFRFRDPVNAAALFQEGWFVYSFFLMKDKVVEFKFSFRCMQSNGAGHIFCSAQVQRGAYHQNLDFVHGCHLRCE